jgi:hypothetical protein
MLDCTSEALETEPGDLDGNDEKCQSVRLVLIPYQLGVYFGLCHETFADEIVYLISINGEGYVVCSLQNEASHIGEKAMPERPVFVTKSSKGINGLIC